MNLIVIHTSEKSGAARDGGLLRFAVCSEPLAGVVLNGFRGNLWLGRDKNVMLAVPSGWAGGTSLSSTGAIVYTEGIPLGIDTLREIKREAWFVISNGRFFTKVNAQLLEKTLAGLEADVVTVDIDPELTAYREKVRLTVDGKAAGFRRLYCDTAEPAFVPSDWPHHLLIKSEFLDRVVTNGSLPGSFAVVLEKCRSHSLRVSAVNVGGAVLDLNTQTGLLSFCQANIGTLSDSRLWACSGRDCSIAPGSRLIGKVLLGKSVTIGPEAVIIGPAIIGDDVTIGARAVVNSSVIGPRVHLSQDRLLQHAIVTEAQGKSKRKKPGSKRRPNEIPLSPLVSMCGRRTSDMFRTWPLFSYTRCLKRIADIIIAIIVLILFLPVMPFIALAIKLNSPGKVFFGDRRQGRYGKEFYCIKFRTMTTGAAKIQDKLRGISQVDGPQFKMADDPRISTVGRFLRETYIDEIPQFFNVLLGQMSVVGPRPSPEAENTLCPPWRDARLSVRPGITGLWQIYRTRQPMKDFQEWIHYDIKYVKTLSLRMDLWICWQTARKLVMDFVRQF